MTAKRKDSDGGFAVKRTRVSFANVVLMAVCGLVIATGTAIIAQQKPASPDALMGEALHQQEVAGDLQAAAATYKKVLADPRASRAVQAKALLQLGRLYEQLSPADSRASYERLSREFADQKPIAAEAAKRLAAATPAPTSPITSRRLWNKYVMFGVPSGDGRYVTFVDIDAEGTGNLFIRDLNAGTTQQLTNAPKGARPNYAGGSVFSSDGSQLAYAWKRSEGYQLRVISRAGTGERVITKNPEHQWLSPVAWSPDRSRILVKVQTKGDVGQIAWVTVADGTVQVLKTVPWTALGRLALSHDGRFVAYDEKVEARPAARTIVVLSGNGQQRADITDGTSRDEVVGWLPGGNLGYLTYRSGRAELWAVQVREGKAQGPATLVTRDVGGTFETLGVTKTGALFYTQVVSTGIAQIASADWAAARLSDVRTISSNLIADFGADWSPDGTRIAYVAHRGTDIARRFIVVYSVADGSTREVVPGEDLEIATTGGHRWSPDGSSYLVNGGDKAHPGAFAVDLATGKLRTMIKVANGYPQIPQWVNGGNSLLYHPREQFKRSGRLLIRDLASGTDREIRHPFEGADAIGVEVSPDERTLAFMAAVLDKAGPASTLHVMPMSGGAARPLVDLPSDEGVLPVAWTPDSQHVIYSRGKNGERRPGSPRADTSGLWIVPASGGQPRQLQTPLPASGVPGSLRVRPDGRQVTFTVSENQIELWTLEGVGASLTSSRR